ncbi:hypothetical protein [Haloplanus aerogenes]|uniref:Uncharacterized protein n=1 Tax=Haloplanus aerogenes TaxID=660522 RepID=A0A3M0CT86_9EURY|nr:hypothetical protein [Haloplanus aerogenes]AZH25961.1 hypothetical protein DU502_11525 [Haloplanus aerogenes]RMB11660.1 hypothetical protein ATH50_3359 [Haloplanus aerogenes]
MTDREAELRQLVAELREHEAVDDAFLAKSFTDRLVIVDIGDGEGVPAEVTDRLAQYDVREPDEADGFDAGGSFAGDVGNATRHHFVDVRTRGSHQSYVVDGYGSL